MLLIIVIIITLSFAADFLSQYIPFEIEKDLISKVDIDTHTDKTGPVPIYLQTIADDLSNKMDLPAGMKITASVVNSNVVNAFATLGGNVVFFTGLLNELPNENAIAMVMAHEIAHIKLRHPIRALGRGVIVGIAIATIAGMTSNDIVGGLIGNTSMLTALSFTRDQESAADKLAVKALVGRYGHAAGSTQLFEVLNQQLNQTGGKVPEFFATHPLNENRIKAIKEQSLHNDWRTNGTTQKIPETITNEIRRLQKELEEKDK